MRQFHFVVYGEMDGDELTGWHLDDGTNVGMGHDVVVYAGDECEDVDVLDGWREVRDEERDLFIDLAGRLALILHDTPDIDASRPNE